MARYWVNDDGNISDTSHWSTSSGGSSGASVPDSTQDVFVDSNSGLGGTSNDIVNVNQSQTWKSLTFNTGAQSKMDRSAGVVTVLEDVTLTGMTLNPGPSPFQLSPAGTDTATFTQGAGTLISCDLTLKGAGTASGATVLLGSDFIAQRDVTIKGAGTFDTGGYDMQIAETFRIDSGTVELNDSIITLTRASLVAWDWNSGGLNAGTSTIKLTGNNAIFRSGGVTTYNRVEFLNNQQIEEYGTFDTLYFESGKTYKFETGSPTNAFKTTTLDGNSSGTITFERIGASGTAYVCAQTVNVSNISATNVASNCPSPNIDWLGGEGAFLLNLV